MTRLLAVGWATVDLERSAAAWPAGASLAPDPHLGANAQAASSVAGLVLLEPSTEGRLAAALARHGEGLVAIYVRVEGTVEGLRTAGLVMAAVSPGPFGPQALVLRGSRFGPSVIAVFDRAAPDTIER